MSDNKKFKVGVFERQGKTKTLYTAYTMWYSTDWEGCCEHIVSAATGKESKKKAIEEHKAKCKKSD